MIAPEKISGASPRWTGPLAGAGWTEPSAAAGPRAHANSDQLARLAGAYPCLA